MKKKKKHSALMPFLIFAFGIGILLYPTASNYYNVVHQSNAIVEYAEKLAPMDNAKIRKLWDVAVEHNKNLYLAQLGEDLPDGALKNYDKILHVSDDGMTGYIDIEKISVHLPIYHGTSEPILQKGIGHLEWSSFPVGGENTHAVLTGHTGLPSARLFTDLEKMAVGDTFVVNTIGEKMTYEVEEILVVLPTESESLSIVKGKDLCTLVTCTPYGVNSHRLLVRGHRIENAEEDESGTASIEESAERSARMPMLRMILIVILCTVMMALLAFWGIRQKGREKKTAAKAPEEKSWWDDPRL